MYQTLMLLIFFTTGQHNQVSRSSKLEYLIPRHNFWLFKANMITEDLTNGNAHICSLSLSLSLSIYLLPCMLESNYWPVVQSWDMDSIRLKFKSQRVSDRVMLTLAKLFLRKPKSGVSSISNFTIKDPSGDKMYFGCQNTVVFIMRLQEICLLNMHTL